MNDFERKLSQQAFRQPPAELRAALFGETENVIVPPRWTWRDWFWPSPSAWGALAAVWVLYLALAWSDPIDVSKATAIAPPSANGESAFFVFHHPTHGLELPN